MSMEIAMGMSCHECGSELYLNGKSVICYDCGKVAEVSSREDTIETLKRSLRVLQSELELPEKTNKWKPDSIPGGWPPDEELITEVSDAPRIMKDYGNNIDDAVRYSCQEPTLVDALTAIAIWENERAIKQAKKFFETGVSTAPCGGGWETCFHLCFKLVMKSYGKDSASEEENNTDSLAIMQMITAHEFSFGGGTNLDSFICSQGLNTKHYLDLATRENIPEDIIKVIRDNLEPEQQDLTEKESD